MKTPKPIGSFAIREKGGAICAMTDGFYFFDFATGAATAVKDGIVAKPGTTFNDGKTDARGRFIAGTLDSKFKESVGSIFSLDASLKCSVVEPAIGCTNGPCFSPDNRTFYCSDSVSRTIAAYDYDSRPAKFPISANLRRSKASAECPTARPRRGRKPLVGIAGGSKIVCFKPDGTIARTVEVPVPIITSVCSAATTST